MNRVHENSEMLYSQRIVFNIILINDTTGLYPFHASSLSFLLDVDGWMAKHSTMTSIQPLVAPQHCLSRYIPLLLS